MKKITAHMLRKASLALRFAIPLLLLCACAVKKPPAPSQVIKESLPPTTTIPENWTNPDTSPSPVETGWLKSFNDPQMEAIVAEALKNNLDLQVAATRIVVAANIVTEVRAQMMPIFGITGSASLTGLYDQPGGFLGKTRSSLKNTSNVLGAVSWELDIWGKIRSQTAAAKQGLAATQSDYQYARMSLAATTAKVWYLATYAQILQQFGQENLKTSQQQLDIAVAQFKIGNAEQQQVDLAQAQLAQNQAQLAQFTNSYLQIVRGLEVLLGRYPSAELKTAAAFAVLPPPVPAGLPSQLLERRPDVMAAEYSFNAAFHLVQATKAARLPSITLTGAGGYTTNAILQDLRYQPWIWTAAGEVLAPIFTGGFLEAQVKIADQNQQAALLHYGQTALKAFDDVEVTIANEHYLKDEQKDATDALKSTEDALNLAVVKYNIGQTDLSPVLQLENVVSATQMANTYVQHELLANRINLYLALGGAF
jgi:NodT family efflux transporter outer membrane factor (OMF) lipoprotein